MRADHRYKPDEKLHLYIEPVGYGFGDDGLGNKVINLAVDLTLKSENGEELGTIADLTSIKLSSRVKNRELFFNLNLSLDPLSTPPGKYLADFMVRDQNSDRRQNSRSISRSHNRLRTRERPRYPNASNPCCRWQFGGVSAI